MGNRRNHYATEDSSQDVEWLSGCISELLSICWGNRIAVTPRESVGRLAVAPRSSRGELPDRTRHRGMDFAGEVQHAFETGQACFRS